MRKPRHREVNEFPHRHTETKLFHGEQTCGCQGAGGRGEMDWEAGVSRCKLLNREWISSKVLLYITGNYIQYLMINHNAKKEFQEECIYMYR